MVNVDFSTYLLFSLFTSQPINFSTYQRFNHSYYLKLITYYLQLPFRFRNSLTLFQPV